MKILFDLFSVSYSHQSGIFIYAMRILKGWYEQGIRNVVVLTTPWIAENFVRSICPELECIELCLANHKRRFNRCLRSAIYRRDAINNSGCDIVFYPMPEPYFFQKTKIPQIGVVHDNAYLTTPWYMSKFMIPFQLLNHKRIISISEYTKQEILKSFRFLKDEKIQVINNCIEFCQTTYPPIEKEPYILCVNNLYKYKNADTLLRAFSIVKNKISCNLILVGSDVCNRRFELLSLAEELRISDRFEIKQNLNTKDLRSLYQHATVFVSPSTMEGFGQTPIEAAVCGTPVITSKETALPESTMGLVYYYEPVYSAEALARVLLEVINCPPNKEELESISKSLMNKYDIKQQSKKVYDYIIQNV